MKFSVSSVKLYTLVFLRTNETIDIFKNPVLAVKNVISYLTVKFLIIHQTHYEKSDWSRAFNQFTIACELDMINAISAADIAFIMSNSSSAWLLSPLECSPQKQNGRTLRFSRFLRMNYVKNV